MRCLVRFITRRAGGGLSQRRHPVEAATLRFGRGTDNEVFLPDIRVALRHAALEFRSSGLVIEAVGDSRLQVNGRFVHQAVIDRKDKIQIGPYRIDILEPEGDEELALSVELVEPLKDDLGRSALVGRTEFVSLMPSKRRWSWIIFLGVIAVTLALPVAAFYSKSVRSLLSAGSLRPDRMASSGTISAPHKNLVGNCQACHRNAFAKVADAACVACHKAVHYHVAPQQLRLTELQLVRCGVCHQEHRGEQPIVRRDQAFCTDCHADLKRKDKETALEDVSDFATNHPEFRPTVVVDPAKRRRERLSLASIPPPMEHSGLKFNHKKHLDPKGVRDPRRGTVVLTCTDCHKLEPGGKFIRPTRMETDCEQCHRLQFDLTAPERQLPHGKPAEVVQTVADFYAARALRRGVIPATLGGLPGEPLAEADRQEARAWADEQTDLTLRKVVFGSGMCGTCHTVIPPETSASKNWEIAPVLLTRRWMPKAEFNHSKHATLRCQDCHAGAERSTTSETVMMPKIAKCRECHGGAEATAAIPSPCLLCHIFHRPDLELMRPSAAAAAERP